MVFNKFARALVFVFFTLFLRDDLVTCKIVKRQTTIDSQDECVVDPGLARRTILLEQAATTWGATLPPMLDRLSEISNSLTKPPTPHEATAMDCTILHQQGYNTSGIYKIGSHHHSVAKHEPFHAYCDMETDEGGWTIFQRRSDGSTDFYRGWDAYTQGFGHLDSEYWMGLDHIHLLTSFAKYELRVDLEAFDGTKVYAKYDSFRVSDEVDNFKLHLSGYSGNASDALTVHSGNEFTTKDHDHDTSSSQNCAQRFTGAWWYYDCHKSNLNGQYLGASQSDSKGMVWNEWRLNEVLKVSEMKMRRKD